MVDTSNWDWDTGEKQIDMSGWAGNFQWVEEPYASPDGESVAAIVNVDEGEFKVCVNGRVSDETYDKIWHLRYPLRNLSVGAAQPPDGGRVARGAAEDTGRSECREHRARRVLQSPGGSRSGSPLPSR